MKAAQFNYECEVSIDGITAKVATNPSWMLTTHTRHKLCFCYCIEFSHWWSQHMTHHSRPTILLSNTIRDVLDANS